MTTPTTPPPSPAPHPAGYPAYPAAPVAVADNDEIDLREIWDILVDRKWLIASVTGVCLAAGVAYAMLAKPIYESNLLIHVEDSSPSPFNFAAGADSFFDIKTPATGEMEIIRSRNILGQTVDNTRYYIQAEPVYLPLIGAWLARRADGVSSPSGLPFIKGSVSGREQIQVAQFDVPAPLEGSAFTVVAEEGAGYSLQHPNLPSALQGQIGTALEATLPGGGTLSLLVSELHAEPGAHFRLVRHSRISTIQSLQKSLQISEKGRQSGILNVSMQHENPYRLSEVLNEIGTQYVRQNIDRKAAEAAQSLSFLDEQLPNFKRELESSEASYNQFRNQRGTIAFDEEAKLVLAQLVNVQTKLVEAEQQRRALSARFTDNHPNIQSLDSQIRAWKGQIASLESRIKTMPGIQQEAMRFQRDIQVNTELYQSMLNSALQLRLVKEGRTGNVRLLDSAAIFPQPVKPRKSLIVALAGILGLMGGAALAIGRGMFFSAIRHPNEIEARTGLNIYASVPLSADQKRLQNQILAKAPGVHLLTHKAPSDPAIESLRSLRTALQFSMLESSNNRVMFTGPTPFLGKSFLSSNFAAVMATGGKRVLLVDADLRKGYLHQYFGLARGRGLSDLISGSLNCKEAIHPQIVPNLDFLSTGFLPPNPAELLMSESFTQLLEQFSRDYDMVIIDTPPVLVAADANAIAAHAGVILLVARADVSQLGEVQESAKRIAQSGKNITGVIFNAMDTSRRHYGSYGYKYGHGYRYTNYRYSADGKNTTF